MGSVCWFGIGGAAGNAELEAVDPVGLVGVECVPELLDDLELLDTVDAIGSFLIDKFKLILNYIIILRNYQINFMLK